MANVVFEPSWLTENKQSSDVILSTYCRIQRNLSGYPFISKMKQLDTRNIRSDITDAVDKSGLDLTYRCLKDYSSSEKRILIEKQLMHEHYILDPENIFFENDNESVLLLVNTKNHVTFLSLTPGLDSDKAYKQIDSYERSLDQYLNFSFSMEFGYLNEDIFALGTGIEVGIIVHLPALQEADRIQKIAQQLLKAGCEINGFFSEDEESMGALYFIELSPQFYLNEKDFLEKLESIGQQILHYERDARKDYFTSRKMELEDQIWRSFGILKYCRKISAEEGILRISDLRLGVYSNILNIPINKLTPLLFTLQKAHLCSMFNLNENECDERIDVLRADFIRSTLFNAT